MSAYHDECIMYTCIYVLTLKMSVHYIGMNVHVCPHIENECIPRMNVLCICPHIENECTLYRNECIMYTCIYVLTLKMSVHYIGMNVLYFLK